MTSSLPSEASAIKLLPHEVVETSDSITASVIWLHGLGADGHDFVPLVPELHLPESMGVRFIFPHAPSIPVTINGGMMMPAWYDILEMSIGRKIDTDQIMHSSAVVHAFIDAEIAKGIPSERIVIAGFSQGGAVGYQAALSYDKPLAGLMALSTYFATHETIERSAANQSLPIRIYHGTHDPVVAESMGLDAFKVLKALGYDVQYENYPMEHSVNHQEITDISVFLKELLK